MAVVRKKRAGSVMTNKVLALGGGARYGVVLSSLLSRMRMEGHGFTVKRRWDQAEAMACTPAGE
jgi:hypothetical protein